MKKVKYNTKEECLKAIETVESLGLQSPDWMIYQLKAFEKLESARSSGNYIWDTFQVNYPYGIMPKEKKECVENTVNMLLEEDEHADEPGLLLGKIQCGKTDTFAGIIGLAFDRGIDIAIVITKGAKALVNQMIMRMKKDYRWFKASDDYGQKSTINIYDIITDINKYGLNKDNVNRTKTVIVCKKQARNMEKLIDLFEKVSPFLKEKKVLIVDDEADFASRNYQSVKMEAKTDSKGKPISQTNYPYIASFGSLTKKFIFT